MAIQTTTMSEDETYLVKHRDVSNIVKFQNSDELAALLEEPFSAIAEAITGWLASGPKAGFVAAGRIVQGALKARLFEQVSQEIKDLRDKGKIRADFADQKLGFQSWVELLTAIDNDIPDQERVEALMAMFFSVNKINASDSEKILDYQLLQITKKLSSGELLLLMAIYKTFRQGRFDSQPLRFDEWARPILTHLQHSLIALVEYHEKALMENQLINARIEPDRYRVVPTNGRLTDLGMRFCMNMEKYRYEKDRQ